MAGLGHLGLAIQIEVPARGRECGAAASGDGAAASGARPGPSYELRSALSGPALPLVSVNPAGPCHRSAGTGHSLAWGRVPPLLALEIPFAGRAAAPLRRGGLLGCQRLNVLRPKLEGLSHLLRVTVPLIDSGDTAESTAAVVQCELNNMRSNAESL
jgi:hypothetical protein